MFYLTLLIAVTLPQSLSSTEVPGLFQMDFESANSSRVQILKSLEGGKSSYVAIFYTSCKTVCPMTVKKVRTLQESKPADRVFLITIEPEVDTRGKLDEFRKKHSLPDNWLLLRSENRKLASMLKQTGFTYSGKKSASHRMHSVQIIHVKHDGSWTTVSRKLN